MKGESVAKFGLIIAFNDCDGVTMVLLTCLCGNRNDWWRLDVTFVSVCGKQNARCSWSTVLENGSGSSWRKHLPRRSFRAT